MKNGLIGNYKKDAAILEEEYLSIVKKIGDNMFSLKKNYTKMMTDEAEEEMPKIAVIVQNLKEEKAELMKEVASLKHTIEEFKDNMPNMIEFSILFDMAKGLGVRKTAKRNDISQSAVMSMITRLERRIVDIIRQRQ